MDDQHRIFDSGDSALFEVTMAAPGPPGSLPLSPADLLHRPSGDIFGWTQDVGMMRQVLDSDWGRLFRNWETLTPTADGFASVGSDGAEIERTGFKAFTKSLGILGTCMKEAPEFANSKRKVASH